MKLFGSNQIPIIVFFLSGFSFFLYIFWIYGSCITFQEQRKMVLYFSEIRWEGDTFSMKYQVPFLIQKVDWSVIPTWSFLFFDGTPGVAKGDFWCSKIKQSLGVKTLAIEENLLWDTLYKDLKLEGFDKDFSWRIQFLKSWL